MTTTVNSAFPTSTNFDGLMGQPAIQAAYSFTNTAPTGQPGMIAMANTTTATALGTTYPIQNLLTLSATGIVSGNGFATRSLTTISGTVTGGAFVSGIRAGLTLSGTQNSADSRVNALFAKIDASAGTATAGYLDAIWADMGATGPSGGWGTNSNCIRCTNTTSGTINSIFYGYGKATFGMDMSDNGAGWVATAGTASTAAGGIKINANGNVRYIQLYSGAPA